MIEVTITGEETIELSKTDDTKVNGVFSFQNRSSDVIVWSTEQITGANKGAIVYPSNERVFSGATTVYFKAVGVGVSVHCRATEL